MIDKTPLELLCPARDINVARQAILHGADAVYIGGPSHGARAAVSNSIADIASIIDLAHLYGVRVYVTLNTLIYDHELSDVERTVRDLYDIGVDALIVQDMSLLRMDLPPIDLHASTQCDIRTPQKARFLADSGFSQLVLPREMSLTEIEAIRAAVPQEVVLEAFVHGALCVSYSGDCQASCIAKGRSANRGECAQMCRLPYDLTDDAGKVIMRNKHLLSLRDLNRLSDIRRLADAGVSSFKIEGRLKDESYVKNTVAAYRQAIDRVIADCPDRYCRASYGVSALTFTPDVNKVFNRGFTQYFIDGRPTSPISMACIDTPKWTGERVGKVVKSSGAYITARLDVPLNNGDGLGYFAHAGSDSGARDSKDLTFTGFQLNRIDGDRLYPATRIDIPAGTVLYRNRDIAADRTLAQKTAERTLAVDMRLTLLGDSLTLTLDSEQGVHAEASATVTLQEARTPQAEARRRALSKLGGTPYRLSGYEDTLADDVFIQASVLSSLRQEAVAKLTATITGLYQRKTRLPENLSAEYPSSHLTYHDNVANRLSEQFYRDHGVTEIEPSVETGRRSADGLTVMTTRYCLRRELGACLMTADGAKLPSPLYLRSPEATYRLDFDCKNCRMHVVTAPSR